MKFVLAILAVLLVGISAAPTPAPSHVHKQHRDVAELLIMRAEHQAERTHEIMHQMRQSGHHHMLQSLEEQVILIEGLVASLKNQLKDENLMHHLHHFHVIEEELLIHENRMSEEIAAIRHIAENHQHHQLNAEQLIEVGHRLVKIGEAALKKHGHLREAHQIENEMKQIKKLMKDLEHKKDHHHSQLVKEEQQLAKHEHTLKQLIEKAEIRNPSHSHHHHHHHDNN